MCGIVFTTTLVDDETFIDGCIAIKHRGPDDTRIVNVDTYHDYDVPRACVDHPALLETVCATGKVLANIRACFHRLSVVNLSDGAMQPFVHNNVTLLCNGEVFNYKKLCKKYNVQTESDCEVIALIYNKLGGGLKAIKKIVNVLDAEYAFVLYDKQRRSVYMGRDMYGIRPLYVSLEGGLSVASEMKALKWCTYAMQLPPGISEYSLHIRKLNIGRCSPPYVWEHPSVHIKVSKVYATIHNHLIAAVKKRLMSDVSIGCFLSGGIDSSIIASIVSSFQPVECFSIGLQDSVDVMYAQMVVAYLKYLGRDVKHHVVTFTVEEGIAAIRDVIYHLETYDVTTIRASVPQYLLSKYISSNTDVKVLFSGEGADEVFGSYKYFQYAPNNAAFRYESIRLLQELHKYDVLRVDRTTAAFGLEVRIPYLDRDLCNFMSIVDTVYLLHRPLEKMLLRKAFEGCNALPNDVLYRRKAAFSDAVSSPTQSWYKGVVRWIEDNFEHASIDMNKYHPVVPISVEALYYRTLFDEMYPNKSDVIDHYWMPKWVSKESAGNYDPSATVLSDDEDEVRHDEMQ